MMRHAPSLDQLAADVRTADGEFALAVLDGLSQPQKTLPCKFFYDARGSDLFEQITGLSEYYPTRSEIAILNAHAEDIARDIRDGDIFVEFGSGSSIKTEIVLDKISTSLTYVPIDVSQSALAGAVDRLSARYPKLEIRPIVADFSHSAQLPSDLAGRRAHGFFPGSTIGNFAPGDACNLLKGFRSVLGTQGRLIIGVDVKKDAERLVRAYDDAQGVTAAFNKNVLVRINHELGGTFDLSKFAHKAIYNLRKGRVEMHLVSADEQDVWVDNCKFHFRAGETIHTENSHKYTVDEFRHLAEQAGWSADQVWMDDNRLFSVHSLK
jgi:dimethylhistidine N-methyltransferase